jgi:uncharacterized protein (UPF0548 family)
VQQSRSMEREAAVAWWRFGIPWSEAALQAYLAELAGRRVNFTTQPEEMTAANGWTVDGTEEAIGVEAPGPPVPDGVFERARQGVLQYDFSDPSIVVGHFDPHAPLVGRNLLLEMKVMGFRFLGGCRVHSVRDEPGRTGTLFGFRYDTLEGHIERGFEWFLLSKDHATGEVRFKIEAHWQLGDFPTWWSRLGFRLFGERYRALWRRRAPERLRQLVRQPAEKPVAEPGELAHRGDEAPTASAPVGGKP